MTVYMPPMPHGWHAEVVAGGYLMIRGNMVMVTVDFERRGFRGGFTTIGKMTSSKVYRGRGWKKALCADAMEWLEEIST